MTEHGHTRPGHGHAQHGQVQHGHPDHGRRDHGSDDGLADLLDLDGELLADYWSRAIGLARDAAPEPVHTVVDLGAGTGVGTLALLRMLPAAHVVAVDAAPAMLERVSRATSGFGARVRTVLADLDDGLPPLPGVDLVWASMSLHHLRDPAAAVAALHGVLVPGGALAVAEFDEQLRMLPPAWAGLEDRLLDALADEQPVHIGSDWSAVLATAGFLDVRATRLPIAAAVRTASGFRYVRARTQRLVDAVGDRISGEDGLRLVDLLAPGALESAGDVVLRGERTVVTGRRGRDEDR